MYFSMDGSGIVVSAGAVIVVIVAVVVVVVVVVCVVECVVAAAFKVMGITDVGITEL